MRELFGHAGGVFANAKAGGKGLFTGADKGTLFLDEIGAGPQKVQLALLDAIEDQHIRPVGGEPKDAVQVDVRIIAATNEDLQDARERGRFRDDLYARLNVLS